MSAPTFSKVTTPSLQGRAEGGSSSYSALWKAEQKFETDGKPQSAYATTLRILQEAEKKGDVGQALSARLRAASLHQEWAPDSFFTDIAELEALRRSETSVEARAVYASILAEIYENNRWRTQAHDLKLTSDDMKEWTSEQYDSAATTNWRLSLTDLPTLARAKSKEWLPFVVQNASSAYFKHDLLHVLWQRARDQRQNVWGAQKEELGLLRQQVEDCYRQAGNREATLLLALDGEPDLQRLREEYADLPLCAEVYLRLMQSSDEEEKKIAWAEEAIKRYPRYERIGIVRNELNALRQPAVHWWGNEVYYPGKTYFWKLRYKNTKAIRLEVYRLKSDFDEAQIERSKQSVSDFFRRHATLIQTLEPPVKPGEPYALQEDSVEWTAPKAGHYAIVYTAATDEREATRRTSTNEYTLFRVSALQTMHRCLPDSTYEVIVVDAESGQPVEGAEVTLYQRDYRTKKDTRLGRQHSDHEGRTHFTALRRQQTQFYIQVTKDDDLYLPPAYTYRQAPYLSADQGATVVRLYTDRAIYRPGQSVHVGGIVYKERHWDASPANATTLELILRDANWKEVAREQVQTDEWGVLSADFNLPEGRLPGVYQIQTGTTRVRFRVEEYKRPTFEVEMDEAPALQWPQEHIQLTGRATGYNGVPVRSGRVTGTYQFTYPYFWWYRHDDSPQMPIDTLTTDETGTFRVAVPLDEIPTEALRYGLYINLNVEVLSPAGETREGSIRVPLCTTPLRLSVSMDEQQDRDRLSLPLFSLLSSTGKTVEGDIRCAILPKGSTTDTIADIAPSGLESALRQLPSGEYLLKARAQAGKDTASAEARFYLFSQTDTRLPRYTDCWLYCPTDSFDMEHPARLQVGSSFTDVALYYCLTGPKGIVKNELIPLSDELRLLEIPYKEEYGDGVTATFAFIKQGELYQRTQSLRLTLPESQLRWEWTSFRDRLHPGDHETWTLRLTTPDGTPANANLMAVIYDASLDQLTPHSWNFALARYHRLLHCNWRSNNVFRLDNSSQELRFPMKTYRSGAFLFDAFDARWTDGLHFSLYGFSNGRPRRLTRSMAARTQSAAEPEALMAVEEAAVPMMMAKQAVTDEVADAEVDAAETADDAAGQAGETLSTASAALRTNFNETAAFMPRLHSNPQTGEVSMSFTLPESLTTWQLLGIAHTKDFLTANLQAQAVARKELMAQLYLPRFLRAGDKSSLRATIQNLTDQPLSGKAILEIFDPETERLLLKKSTSFQTEGEGETVLSFDYTPGEANAIVAVRLTAETQSTKKAAKFSDGEQRYLPILPSKEWITESIEIQADSAGTFTTDLSTLFNKNHPTATQRRLTVEYTTHPIWNVVQALPALREPKSDDVLSLTSLFYANAMAAHIAAVTPRLRNIITLWKQQAATSKTVTESPLASDEELKQLLLDETPWLREAAGDAERRAQLIDLFNENLVDSRLSSTLDRLLQRQQADGGFSWFPGMRSSELMTRLVAIELTRLRTLTNDFQALPGSARSQANDILRRAFNFIAEENARLVQRMKNAEAKGEQIQTGRLMHLHYVYIAQRAGVSLSKSQKADVRYLLDHLKGSVAGMSNDERAMAAIVLKTDGRKSEAQGYYESMCEHLTATSDHGTFFAYAGGSFTPTGNKIIIHTTAMEAADELQLATDGQQSSIQRGLRRWLLQQKRTQMWESSICTVDAIYALLHGAAAMEDLQDTSADGLTLNFGKRTTVVSQPSGADSPAALGYLRATYTDGAAPRSITARRSSNTEAWGAVHAQYLTPVADASAHATGLSVRRELSSATPRLGDKLTTRYVITADRDYEYVCLRAERPACAEPAEQMSGYRYQGGLGYYRAVRDAHTDYFFDRLPKGTYILEETSFIDRTGHYTTGLCRLQCLYAPEYNSHTTATELKVEN